MKFAGKVEKGKLTLDDLFAFKDYLKEIDGDVHLEIKSVEKVRSPQQNAYYRVIIRILSKELGYEEDEMHLIVKQHFKIISTKKLSKYDFSRFIEKLERWAITEFNIKL